MQRSENMKKAIFVIAFAIVLLYYGAPARTEGEAPAVPADMVIMSDGNIQTGYVTDIAPEGAVTLATEFSARPTEIALSRVSGMNLNMKDRDLAKRIRKGWIFYLADGARITGRLRSWADDFVTVHIDYGAEIKIPRNGLLRVSTSGGEFFGQTNSDKPVVYLTGDQKASGTLKEVSGEKIVVAGTPDQEFRPVEVHGIALPQPKPVAVQNETAAMGWYVFVEMPNADRIIGQIDKLSDGTLYVITQYCGVMEIKRNDIARLTFNNAMQIAFGNTLITDIGRSTIIEVDPEGKEVWTRKSAGLSDARLLPNGDVLVTSSQLGMVAEIDRRGNTVWIRNLLVNPVSAVCLPDGNIAVAETGKFRIVIFDRQGNQVKTLLEGKIQPNWIDVTPQGTLLVTDQSGTAMEVNMNGEVLWAMPDLRGITCARMLPTGEIAVLQPGLSKIVIFKKPNQLVKSINVGYGGERCFKVLANGNILIVQHNPGDTVSSPIIREIDPAESRTVRETKVQGNGYVNIGSVDRN